MMIKSSQYVGDTVRLVNVILATRNVETSLRHAMRVNKVLKRPLQYKLLREGAANKTVATASKVIARWRNITN